MNILGDLPETDYLTAMDFGDDYTGSGPFLFWGLFWASQIYHKYQPHQAFPRLKKILAAIWEQVLNGLGGSLWVSVKRVS